MVRPLHKQGLKGVIKFEAEDQNHRHSEAGYEAELQKHELSNVLGAPANYKSPQKLSPKSKM